MEPHWILCGILLLVVLICTWGGYKRGVLKMVFSTASLLVTLLIAGLISPLVQTALTEHTQIYDTIYNGCHSYVQEHVHIEGGEIVDTSQLPEFVADALTPVADGIDATVTNATAAIAANVARLILSALSFLVTFFLVGVIMRVASGMLKLIDKLPVIHEGNHLAGLLLGFFQGILAVWVFFLIVECCIGTPFGSMCSRMIRENPLLSFVSAHNWILILIERFTGSLSLGG